MEIGNEEITHQNVWPTDVVKSPLFTKLGSSWEIEVGQMKRFLFGCLLRGRAIAWLMTWLWEGLCRLSEPPVPVLLLFKLNICAALSGEGLCVSPTLAEQLLQVPGGIQSPPPSAGFKKTTGGEFF